MNEGEIHRSHAQNLVPAREKPHSWYFEAYIMPKLAMVTLRVRCESLNSRWPWKCECVEGVILLCVCVCGGCLCPLRSLSSGVSVWGGSASLSKAVVYVRGGGWGSLSMWYFVQGGLSDRKWHHTETPNPLNRVTDRRVWKHYLPTTSFYGR